MSWDSYIDSVLGQSGGNGDKAAIIAVEGGVPWTGAHNGLGMVFQDDESVNIARAFKSKDFTVFQVRQLSQIQSRTRIEWSEKVNL